MSPVIRVIVEALGMLVVVFFAGGFLFGYVMCAYITFIHKRAGNKSPFGEELTPMLFGLMFGGGIALARTILMMLIRYQLI